MAEESRKPVGRIMAVPKSDPKDKSGHVKIGAVWASKFPGKYSLSFGDRDCKVGEVLDILEQGDYFINMQIFEDKSNDGF